MSLRRPARVLFLSVPEDRILADGSARWARRLGTGWVDARASLVSPTSGSGGAGASEPTAEAVAWADTVVFLATSDISESPGLPPGTRSTQWQIPADGDADQIDERLRERVSGMLGGLRLLAAMRD